MGKQEYAAFRKVEADIAWLCAHSSKLEEKRNNVVHAPLSEVQDAKVAAMMNVRAGDIVSALGWPATERESWASQRDATERHSFLESGCTATMLPFWRLSPASCSRHGPNHRRHGARQRARWPVLSVPIWRPSLDRLLETPTYPASISRENVHDLEDPAYHRDHRRFGDQLLRLRRSLSVASRALRDEQGRSQ